MRYLSHGVRPALLASVEEREARRMSMKSFGDHRFRAHTRAAVALAANPPEDPAGPS